MENSRRKTLHHVSQVLTDFGPAYFDHVLAEYDSLPHDKHKDTPEYIRDILTTNVKDPGQLTWKDLYLLEKYVLSIQPPEVLRARVPGLQSSYRGIKGETAYKEYLRSRPTEEHSHFKGLKADLGRLLDSLHWVYSMVPEREQMRTDIIKLSGMWLLICFVLLLPIVLIFGFKGQTLLATIPLVAFMGALGGFLSLQRRLQNIPTENDPLLTMLELENGRFSVSMAPLTGAIFAIVLFLVFVGGLIQGTLFPGQLNFSNWKLGDPIQAEALASYGKLLLWSFIAGFAEKFVPDTLDSIASKGSQASKPKVVAGASKVRKPEAGEVRSRGKSSKRIA